MKDREQIKRLIRERLRRDFPEDTVDVADGYQRNIHVTVVSRKFDSMRERDKQDLLWGLIDDAGLDESDKQLISLILPVSPGEISP